MQIYNTQYNNGLPIVVREKEIPSNINFITESEHLYDLCRNILEMYKFTEEYIYAIAVNAKGKIIGLFEISHGTVNQSLLSPREVFQKLLLIGSVSFFLAHNHPSQIVDPSVADLQISKRMYHAGKLLGIELLDHIIVGKDSFYSIREEIGFDKLVGNE